MRFFSDGLGALLVLGAILLYLPVGSAAEDGNYGCLHCTDAILKAIEIDKDLMSDFFGTVESSYPWYVLRHDDGTFSSALDKELTEKDLVRIEHTSNCISTHQGIHVMHFCDAILKEDGDIRLRIHGGLPAYASSLQVDIKGNWFSCCFNAAYPVRMDHCRWNILSKELTLKNRNVRKGKRLYAWICVEFQEVSNFRGKTQKRRYKISGYVKPVLK